MDEAKDRRAKIAWGVLSHRSEEVEAATAMFLKDELAEQEFIARLRRLRAEVDQEIRAWEKRAPAVLEIKADEKQSFDEKFGVHGVPV